MKKTVLIIILCFSVSLPAFAQNNMEGMRFLTINALMQYGQKLYERGDFNEATAVFKHVLTYDSHQSHALEYLKEMGYVPTQEQLLNHEDLPDAPSLKKAIEDEKQVIKKLKGQIMWMRANIVSQPIENQSN